MIFEFREGLIWSTFDLEYEGQFHKITNCIIDTRSATTAIDIDIVKFNYRKPASVKRLYGIGGGTQEVVTQKVDKVIIDQIELKSVEIEFGELQEELGINGFIGNDLLSRFIVIIDFSKREIELAAINNHIVMCNTI